MRCLRVVTGHRMADRKRDEDIRERMGITDRNTIK
jgi:hypothetical protein